MNARAAILLVDPDRDNVEWMKRHLASPNVGIATCSRVSSAREAIERHPFDLVICDFDLEGESRGILQPGAGLDLLDFLRTREHPPEVLMISSHGSSSLFIQAIQRGAQDVLRKESLPFDLRHTVENALQAIDQRRQAARSRKDDHANPSAATPPARDSIIGSSRKMQEVFKLIGKVSRSLAPVLITGESGSGKEVIARAIHDFSARNQRPLVTVNCAAIPENLLESELFGHEKGAFTGAYQRREGRFEAADGGTLFLDEIGEMPLSIQVKLLRVLQDGSFSRVGSNETLHSDARIIAATNRDLAREVSAGRFREDLYYRLNVVPVPVPPLRERPEDIPLLAEFFLQKTAKRLGSKPLVLSAEASDLLQNYGWPGNVRELENTISRACALAHSPILLPGDIPLGQGFLLGGSATPEQVVASLVKLPLPAGVPESSRATYLKELIDRYCAS